MEEKIDKKTPLPKEVENILSWVKDIINDGKPTTLPPKRAISHQIDFIPGASLPNKEEHKMNPKQNEEISKQVKELVDHGLIRKSMSSCVIPIVLVPKKGATCKLCTNT